MFTIHITDAKTTLWIFKWLLVLYLNCKSFMNFVPVIFFFFLLPKNDKCCFFLCHLINRDGKEIFVAILCMIFTERINPDEKLHMEWVCISDDGFRSFVQTGNFYILSPGCFCHFYMFVMNKMFYSECTRLGKCFLHVTMNWVSF